MRASDLDAEERIDRRERRPEETEDGFLEPRGDVRRDGVAPTEARNQLGAEATERHAEHPAEG